MGRVRQIFRESFSELPKNIIISIVIAALGLLPTLAQWLLVATGLWNFDASLSGFSLGGWKNEVSHPNQTIRADAVWSMPLGTVVRLREGGLLTVQSIDGSVMRFSYVAESGENASWLASGGTPKALVDNCTIFTITPMSRPVRGEDSLVMFTTKPVPDCLES